MVKAPRIVEHDPYHYCLRLAVIQFSWPERKRVVSLVTNKESNAFNRDGSRHGYVTQIRLLTDKQRTNIGSRSVLKNCALKMGQTGFIYVLPRYWH